MTQNTGFAKHQPLVANYKSRPAPISESQTLDFLHKSGKGAWGKGKGFVFSPSPLTFSLFPTLAKVFFARGLLKNPVHPKSALRFLPVSDLP
ncbi:hypothetical protein [Nostoc sp. 2RC]|uniref:hypothetical protein n=1 Tax=Nostoc sp. 2RC TaxID=2485484 RepID=UPI001625A13C|nr:hypothetical protein [Nostoc sp. 2RC]MBC1236836.1 hypothetical protein [Nostoc sp. 2RC]